MHVKSPYFGFHADVAVWVRQQGLNTYENFGYGQGQTPIMLDGIDANVSVSTDVGMEDLGNKPDNWWSHWIAAIKIKSRIQEFLTSLVALIIIFLNISTRYL